MYQNMGRVNFNTWVFILCIAFFSSASFADSEHSEMMEKLARWIQRNSAYKDIDINNLPVPLFLQQTELCNVAGLTETCGAKGLERGSIVYLLVEFLLKDDYSESILLHELVHYFQRKKGGDAKTCKVMVNREFEAYLLQNQYLASINSPRHVYIPSFQCPDHENI